MPEAVNDETLSRAFDAGNYAQSYSSQHLGRELSQRSFTTPESRAAFVLGFFATYEMHEIEEGHDRETYCEAYRSPAGQRCLALGFMEPREWFMGEALGLATLGMYAPEQLGI